MPIKTTVNNGHIILKAGKGTQDPVTEVLTMLGEGVAQGKERVFIDLSGMKRSRFPNGAMGKLYASLPDQTFVRYIFGVADNMVSEASSLAEGYKNAMGPEKRPNYMVATGTTLTMLANQL